MILSLVAVEEDQIAGHILFNRLAIEIETDVLHPVSLAPMAVPAMSAPGHWQEIP